MALIEHSLDYWLPFIGVAGGYIFGALLTWLLLRNRLSTTRARLEERLRAADKHVADLEAGAANLEQEVTQLRHSEALALKQQGSLEGALAAERKLNEDKMKILQKAEERMLGSFRLISQECLKESQQQLASIAASTPSEIQAARDTSAELLPLLEPLAESLDRIENRISTLEQERQNASLLLRDQISRAIEHDEEKPASSTTSPSTPKTPADFTPGAIKRDITPAPSNGNHNSTKQERSLPTIPEPKAAEDPRPYATPTPLPTPEAKTFRQHSSPSTFLEDLDTGPVSTTPENRESYRKSFTLDSGKSKTPETPETSAALPPVKLRPFDEKVKEHDVLDDDLDDNFVGFSAIEPKQVSEPDPKKAADDLRAALES